VEHIACATRFVTRADLAVAPYPVEPPLQLRQIGNRSSRVGVFAPSGSTATVIDSLCTSIPR